MKRIAMVSWILTACGSDGGGSNKNSQSGSPTTLAVESAAALPACTTANESQLVYLKEEAIFKTCTKAIWTTITIGNTTSVKQQLVKVEDVQAGAICEAGGKKIMFGNDTNANTTLDTDEVISANTQVICNGTKGSDGLKAKYLYRYHVDSTASSPELGAELSSVSFVKLSDISIYQMSDDTSLYVVNGIATSYDSGVSDVYSSDFSHTFLLKGSSSNQEAIFKVTGFSGVNIRYTVKVSTGNVLFKASVNGDNNWSNNTDTSYSFTVTSY